MIPESAVGPQTDIIIAIQMTAHAMVVAVTLSAIVCMSQSLVQATAGASDVLSEDQCLELGFRRSELQCFRCQDLDRFELNELQESCLRCCQQKEEKETARKYASAVLEICACNLGHYPQVQAFVKSDRPKAFSKLAVKHVPGQHPTIKLLDSKGTEVEEMSIKKWDTDTIEEFLREHLLT